MWLEFKDEFDLDDQDNGARFLATLHGRLPRQPTQISSALGQLRCFRVLLSFKTKGYLVSFLSWAQDFGNFQDVVGL